MNATPDLHTALTRDLLPVGHDRGDRLPPMLFVSSLVWSVLILGITFEAELLPDLGDTTSLEVTIVADNRSTARPEKADYLAQSNQAGNGNTRERVSAAAAPQQPGRIPLDAERVGPATEATAPGEPTPSIAVATTADAARQVYRPDDPVEQEDSLARVAQAEPVGIDVALPLPDADDPSLLITDDNPRHLVVSVNAAQSDIAPYLAAWKRRVERIGTRNFPRELLRAGASGSPTLSVAIAPDGQLSGVELLRSSGDRSIDQAALLVVNRAAPFQAFPPELRERYDLLRFAYKFEFRGADFSSTVSVEP